MGITYKFILYVGLSIIMPIELMQMIIFMSFYKDMDIYIYIYQSFKLDGILCAILMFLLP
jgi:hypothetical protein